VSNNYDHNRDASPDVDEHQHRNHHLLERNEPRESVIQILCSEGFFTDSNQAAAELSSGHWCTNLIRQETPVVSNIKFDLRDSRIVDDCGVDIELPDRVGIKVLWMENQVLHDAFDSKKNCKELVQLASTGRYISIFVIIALNAGVGCNYNVDDLCLLQNALVKQRGCVCQKISFHYVAASLLGATIAQLVISHQPAPSVCLESLIDDNVIEKVSFLLGLIPTLTAYEALSFLNSYTDLHFGRLVLSITRKTEDNSHINCNLRPASLLQLRRCILGNAGIFTTT